MSIWKVMNWVAWGLAAVLLGSMLWDFFKVERAARLAKPGAGEPPVPPPAAASQTAGIDAPADRHDGASS